MTKFKIKKTDDEYQVRVYIDGVYNEARTYYTDDKDDALETMLAMEIEENFNINVL